MQFPACLVVSKQEVLQSQSLQGNEIYKTASYKSGPWKGKPHSNPLDLSDIFRSQVPYSSREAKSISHFHQVTPAHQSTVFPSAK